MADLPPEVITEILCRLPVKTILRFRCISKSWKSVIDSPEFIFLHLNKSIESKANINIIFRKSSDLYAVDFATLDRAEELNHPLMCYSNRIKVLGSCNGILCISNVAEDVALWNPSIRKHKVIPFLSVERRPDYDANLFVARVYGFGYDSFTDDYKLLRLSYFIDLQTRAFDSQVKLYSLRKNAWKSLQSMPYALCSASTMGVFVVGALHWAVTRKLEPSEPDFVVAFDLKSETFREVPLPDTEEFQMDVALLGGCLCMLANYHKTRVDVWLMKEYGIKESWCKLFTLTQPHDLKSFKSVRPLAFSGDGEKVLLEQDHKRLCWYDLKNKGVNYVKISGMRGLIEATICMESLVPPTLENKNGRKKKKLENEKTRKKRDDFLSKGFKLTL